MSSRSSRSSKASSRTSDAARSDTASSTCTTCHRHRLVASSPETGRSQYYARSLRDIQEKIEACELELANAEAKERHAVKTMIEAEALKRNLAVARDRARQKHTEMMRYSHSQALDTQQSSMTPRVLERSPDDWNEDGLSLRAPSSGSSEIVNRSSISSKSRKGRLQVVGIARHARPRTIWGGPAWA